ncbi:MAG: prohibitin family protein [Acidimicrobiia bacterium]|nr:prohibitin family protein [Acidimicrobiia bacterium]
MAFFILSLISLAAAVWVMQRTRHRRAAEGRRSRATRIFIGVPVGLAVLFMALSAVRVVPAGHVGVPVVFGRVGKRVGPGIHLVNPVTDMRNMSVRTEQYTMASTGLAAGAVADDSVDVLGRDGAAGRVNATLLYKLDRTSASTLYSEIGSDYMDKVIRPSARSCVRSAFAHFDMVEAATTSWASVDDDITECLKGKLEPSGIVVQDFQLRELDLDDQVQRAIDAKVAAQQAAERQQFELAKAEQQANIRRVEAHATADSQQILACGGEVKEEIRDGRAVNVVVPKPIDRCSQAQLTPQYLQFTYIQALKELVNSPNNSTIILPFDENLTPLLNVEGSSTPIATAPSTAPPSTTAPTTTAP